VPTRGPDSEQPLLAGRYRLGALLGAGGMGAVHRATDTKLARQVAIKVLAADALGDQAARQRLIREALACAALHHPGIVHVYDVGETDDGGAFLVMELVTGTSLRVLVEDPSWTDRDRLAAVVEAARALAAAHRAGLIHRDVKPDNLMLRDDGRVVLLDFGIAKPSSDAAMTNLTGAGVVIGTPAYLSPEQARGRALDARTDQFSLAVTAYELLARVIPWAATSAIEVVAAIMNDTPPPLQLADASLADAVRPVLEQAMAKKPEDRFADADAFADALGLAAGLPVSPHSAPMSVRAGRSSGPASLAATALAESTPDAHARTVAAPSSETTLPRRRRRAVPVAVVALLAAAVATGVGVWRYRHNPLDAPFPILACPMFEGSIDGKPAPWLGAAAAYRLADDLAPMLGGFDEHVEYPAALLETPGYAPGAHELDPWTGPGLRDRSIRAATSAGHAWLDGRVEAHGVQMTLTVTVRSPSGRALGTATGTGTPLRIIALEVSRKLRASGALGSPHDLEPEFRAWQGVASAGEQDATMDLEVATLGHSPVRLCKVAPPPGLPASWRAAVVDGCAGKPIDVSLPAPALAREIAVAPEAVTPELRARFQRDVAALPTGQRKALALGATQRMEDTSDESGGSGLLAMVAADPRAGWNGVREGMVTASPTLIANAIAWAPDNSDWWLTATRALPPSDRAGASEFLRREFILMPYASVAALYADSLLREGNASELGAVVAHLAGSDDPDDRDLGRLIAARAAVLDGAFARTLARWTDELTRPGSVLGDTDDDNPRISSARELAFATSAERGLGDAMARAIIDRTAALRVADSNVTVRLNLAATCALAEPGLAARCVDALAVPETAPALQREDWRRAREVIERYVAGDFARAADVARGLMGSRYYPYYGVRLGDFLVDVFDRGGVPEMAEELDLPHIDDRNLHGASLATLRAARRAWVRGDRERARGLARRIVESWKLVDMTVPAVAEMQPLIASP
jgi:predicted Ser/Thr protein kinase